MKLAVFILVLFAARAGAQTLNPVFVRQHRRCRIPPQVRVGMDGVRMFRTPVLKRLSKPGSRPRRFLHSN